MKKLALILAMVCFVLSFGFSQEFKPAVTIGGDASLILGFNLDSSVLALKNAVTADLKLTLVPQATSNKGGEGTYGWIELKEFKLEQGDLITGVDFTKSTTTTARSLILTNPKISAKIVSGPFYLQFMDESNATKTVSAGGYSMPNISDGKFLSTFGSSKSESTAGVYAYAGYGSDAVDFTLKVVNNNDYCKGKTDAVNDTDADGDVESVWFVAPSVALKMIPNLTIKAGAVLGTPEAFNTGLGVSLEYKLALNDKISVVPVAGFDYILGNTKDVPETKDIYSLGAGVYAKWGGNDEYKAYRSLAADCFNTYKLTDDSKVKYQGGVGFGVQYNSDKSINALIQVNEQRGDDGLVPGLGAAVGVELVNVTAEKTVGTGKMVPKVGAFVNYAMGNVTPFARVVYNAEKDVTLGAGVEIAKILPNTTVSAEYNSLNVLASSNNSGLITASVKVAF